MRFVRIEIDESLEPGKFRVGGVRIVEASGEALLRGLQTSVVFARDEDGARVLREMIEADRELELTE